MTGKKQERESAKGKVKREERGTYRQVAQTGKGEQKTTNHSSRRDSINTRREEEERDDVNLLDKHTEHTKPMSTILR